MTSEKITKLEIAIEHMTAGDIRVAVGVNDKNGVSVRIRLSGGGPSTENGLLSI
jgi:hypothetical protein